MVLLGENLTQQISLRRMQEGLGLID